MFVSSCSCVLIICYLISITMSIYLYISHCVTLQISQFIELVTVSFFYMWMFTFPDTIIWWGCLFCNIPFRCFGETQMVTAPWACSSSAALIALGVLSSATTMVLLFVWFFTVIRNHGGVRTNQALLYVPGLALHSPVHSASMWICRILFNVSLKFIMGRLIVNGFWVNHMNHLTL